MRGLLRMAAVLAGPLAAWAQAPVSYTGGTYTQDFDSMGPFGTNTPPGWFVGVGDVANVKGPLNVGEGFAGITSGAPGWNFGNTNSPDRSLGTAATGPNRVMELRLVNNSGSPLGAFEIRYDGEQWRSATGVGTGTGNDTIDRYRLQFSTDGINYVEMGESFNFTVPHPSPATRYDGKQATNRVANIGGSYAPASPIPTGAAIHLRWFDFNLVTPTDAYMAIDNVAFRSASVAPVWVTQQPQSANGTQCGSVSFTVGVSGSSPAIQWQKSTGGGAFMDLDGENGLTLIVSNLAFPNDNGAQFRAHVSNSLNATDSVAATLTVTPDTILPAVVRAIGESDLISFTVTFSEAMDSASVIDQAGYQLRSQDGLETLALASLTQTAPATISIVTTSPRDANKNYLLEVNTAGDVSLREACNLNNVVTPTVVPVTVSIQVFPLAGQPWRYLDNSADVGDSAFWAARDYDDSSWRLGLGVFDWKDTGPRSTVNDQAVGTTLIGINAGGFRTTNVYFRTSFTLPGPAEGATISVRVMADDGYVLYLNGEEVHRLRVAAGQNAASYATGNSPNGAVTGDTAIEGPFLLTVGNLVNGVNVLAAEVHQSGDGSSDLDFALELSALVTSVFSGPVTFALQPQSLTIHENQTAVFSVSADGSRPITYAWQQSSGGGPFIDIAGQTNSSLVFAAATPADAGDYRVVANNSFGPAISDPATLTVTPDLMPPTLLSAVGSTNAAMVTLTFSRAISVATGGSPANYLLVPMGGGPPLTIVGAVVTGANIELTTAPRIFGTGYRLTITGLRDTTATGNLLDPDPTVVDPLPQDFVVFSWNQNWRYETNCQDGMTWQAAGFDDSAWQAGPGSFGLEPSTAISNLLESLGARILTPLPIGTAQLAYYFRTRFDWPYSTAGVQFRLSHLVDDGAIFYLNGAPVVAFNQTNTPPLNCTNLSIGDGETSLQTTNLPGVAFGPNLLAAEVHQQTTGSSDVVFGAQLVARLTSFGALGPRLAISDLGKNTVRITWTPASGTLQFKNNLDEPSWTDVPTQTAGNTLVPRDQLKRFYSLRQ